MEGKGHLQRCPGGEAAAMLVSGKGHIGQTHRCAFFREGRCHVSAGQWQSKWTGQWHLSKVCGQELQVRPKHCVCLAVKVQLCYSRHE